MMTTRYVCRDQWIAASLYLRMSMASVWDADGRMVSLSCVFPELRSKAVKFQLSLKNNIGFNQ